MSDIFRQEYIDWLAVFRDKPIIKVITGVRRCGKSTVMAMFRDELHRSGVPQERLIFLNFEDMDNEPLLDPHALHSYIKSRIPGGEKIYVFLDEIQNVREFPRVVDSLFVDGRVDIYVTGSNAYLLSGELATYLSGRYVLVEMLPLSFREFADAQGDARPRSELYRLYVERSSFPYVTRFSTGAEETADYLRGVYSTIILKDVVNRYKISDAKMLESVVRFVFDSVGSPLSPKRIADTMTSAGRKIDAKTVEKYLSALEDTFIVYEATRYDVKGKQHLKLLSKYYAVDIGLRTMLLGKKSMDVGHILENVVYLELLRRRYKVYVGKVGDAEIDFVAQDEDGSTYVQVAATVRDESTLARELRPLRAVKDHYPKLLLTLDDDPEADFDGIRRMNAIEWLYGAGAE